jgi:hypothetical protein
MKKLLFGLLILILAYGFWSLVNQPQPLFFSNQPASPQSIKYEGQSPVILPKENNILVLEIREENFDAAATAPFMIKPSLHYSVVKKRAHFGTTLNEKELLVLSSSLATEVDQHPPILIGHQISFNGILRQGTTQIIRPINSLPNSYDLTQRFFTFRPVSELRLLGLSDQDTITLSYDSNIFSLSAGHSWTDDTTKWKITGRYKTKLEIINHGLFDIKTQVNDIQQQKTI